MARGCKSESGLTQAECNDTLRQRFELKCGDAIADGCIPWLAGKTRKGYGLLRTNSSGSRTTAHRIAWVLKHGDLSPGVLVLHSCDNPSCVNADHLFLGSPQDNTDDMVSKRRHAWRAGTPWQRLNSVDGERIRDLRRTGRTHQEIANWMGVSRPLISMILAGKIQHSAALTGI